MIDMVKNMKIVPDTSVIIDGRITRIIRGKKFGQIEVVVPEAVVAELEAQASRGQETGYKGLDELGLLARLSQDGKIKLRYVGNRPSLDQIRLAGGGEIDAMIRDVALAEDALLVTSDSVQSRVAEAKGIRVEYMKSKRTTRMRRIRLLNYFGPDVMSVHLRSHTLPRIKVGIPGKMELKEVGGRVLTDSEMKRMAKEIIEATKVSRNGFIEIDEGGATVVQLENIRIAIARPPFADAWEITAVRPVALVGLDQYKYADEIKGRLRDKYRGVLIAGPPGAGKSTLAQAVAEYLESLGWIVKTMEKPRDLQVSEKITQYSALEGDMAKTADILLLVRPDYTIYDELRKTPDFQVFADMRLAGVGMVGVVHATRGIDAIQRLVGRVELGMIPQIVDTVLFVEDAAIRKLYDIKFTVKVPAGMTEQDLARPVIEVMDHETKRAEFEIYSYGEEVVVMPVEKLSATQPVWSLAERQIAYEIARHISGPIQVDVDSGGHATVYVNDRDIPRLLGKEGKRIMEIEDGLGVRIDVRSLEDMRGKPRAAPRTRKVEVDMDRRDILVAAGEELSGNSVEVLVEGEPVFVGTVGRDGNIRLAKGSQAGKVLQDAFFSHKDVTVRPVEA